MVLKASAKLSLHYRSEERINISWYLYTKITVIAASWAEKQHIRLVLEAEADKQDHRAT